METAIAEQLAKKPFALRGAGRKPNEQAALKVCGKPRSSFFRSTGRRCEISTEQPQIAEKEDVVFDRAW
jgi:hypothetical protein